MICLGFNNFTNHKELFLLLIQNDAKLEPGVHRLKIPKGDLKKKFMSV